MPHHPFILFNLPSLPIILIYHIQIHLRLVTLLLLSCLFLRLGFLWICYSRVIMNKKQAIWREVRRLWCIITRIRRKNQGFVRETKTWATPISYNPIAYFYVILKKYINHYISYCQNIIIVLQCPHLNVEQKNMQLLQPFDFFFSTNVDILGR